MIRPCKQNVVTGLPESSDVTDEQALCEENFSFKPAVSHLCCQRFGKISEQYKSWKLLIHLRSEEVARDVLAEAKKLRKSDNANVASSVYINHDQSPAEATLAYERRQQKRIARQKRAEQERKKNQQPDPSVALDISDDVASLVPVSALATSEDPHDSQDPTATSTHELIPTTL